SKEFQALIERGRGQGFLTYDDVNAAIPQDMVSTNHIDSLMERLEQEGIEVVDSPVSYAGKKAREAAPAAGPRLVAEEESLTTPVDESYTNRSSDPVRMYLRKMGSVSLLTREGEVEIARRIERGENEILEVILNSRAGISEIIEIGEKLKKGIIRIKSV